MKSKCILWDGAISKKGYGALTINGKTVSAHQLSYRLFHGGIPAGMFVCHKCDVPNCINPDHLFLGTPKDNTQDMTMKGRGLYGRCPLELIDSLSGKKQIFKTQREAGESLGVTQSAVSFAIRRNTLILNRYTVKWQPQKQTP